MTKRTQIPFQLTALGAAVLAISGAVAQTETEEDTAAQAIYTPLLITGRYLDTRWQGDYTGGIQLGLGYTSDDNFMFGQYNGLYEEDIKIIGNLRWQDISPGDSYWRASVDDLGLDTRQGEIAWGKSDQLRLSFGFDSQIKAGNNTGATPFRGGDSPLRLPQDWVTGSTTGDFSQLQASLQQFDQELERDKLSAALAMRLSDAWHIDGNLSYEERQGTDSTAGAIYSDASTGDAALLPLPVDYRTTEFDAGVTYSGGKLNLEGRVNYSDFDNKDDILVWQNPYRSRSPESVGGLGLAPDNDQLQGRFTGQYLFSPKVRLQFDGSYAVSNQDQSYLDYSANPAAVVVEPLPRDSFDGEAQTGTLNGKLWLRPLRQMDVEVFYKARERDYDNPRDGYRYIRGDGSSQPDAALTVYNTSHHFLSQTTGLEGTYRLPMRSRLQFGYAFERVERENAAVEETEEDQFTLGYRIQPLDSFTARLELLYGNRSADTYNWDQRYYALLDVALINATPDNQRYINHPELSQYYMANREQEQGKLDLAWMPAENWNLNFNLLVRNDDYDKTYTGLRYAYWERYHLSASYSPGAKLSASLYGGYDRFESEQMGRSFRGGAEKNAFEIYPPLPQASDPDRDWRMDATDTSITLGANVMWQLSESIDLEADYSYVDTESDQAYRSYGAADVNPQDLPTVSTTLHHFRASGNWHMRKDLSLRLDYQYYRYQDDDWALQGVAADTIDKVLTFGARNPNEKIHYVGVSAIYRWN
ncbi:MtrB/PioB family decaheme-associated outer membrane protein [Pseudohalioglobus sediminis]|uniref:MtrB/PioB family decaheme-associated outer membrane protein n=1 Tax=Pseudohalioglobus sediminis TaxID=2606449 RepID=A0A5B0WQJ9_9GAMM|nr:MtrB/PioB family decaheme-associated outer membrane protein [Pseudohalioglobus sediminis]KAA1188461.1 MtrB/PioB family decaheme-associated outer membrane protein [Pseudohalioglobus sediminis]